jgi:hypothetical protein
VGPRWKWVQNMTWRFGALFGVFVVVASCGGDKDGPTGRDDPLTTSQGICARWAAAACNDDVVRACNGSSGLTAECVGDQQDFCLEQLTGDGFDRELAQDCIDAVEDAYSDGEITAEERLEVILLESGPCADTKASGDEAAGGAGGTGGGSGPAPKQAGARCDPDVDVCVDTAYCDPAVDVCVLKAAEGELCCVIDPRFLEPACESGSPEVPCTPGTFCSEGTCVSLGKTDDPCVTNEQCATNYFCGPDDTCLALGTDSDNCDPDAPETQCASGFFCSESFSECRDFIVVGTPELCNHLGVD